MCTELTNDLRLDIKVVLRQKIIGVTGNGVPRVEWSQYPSQNIRFKYLEVSRPPKRGEKSRLLHTLITGDSRSVVEPGDSTGLITLTVTSGAKQTYPRQYNHRSSLVFCIDRAILSEFMARAKACQHTDTIPTQILNIHRSSIPLKTCSKAK